MSYAIRYRRGLGRAWEAYDGPYCVADITPVYCPKEGRMVALRASMGPHAYEAVMIETCIATGSFRRVRTYDEALRIAKRWIDRVFHGAPPEMDPDPFRF